MKIAVIFDALHPEWEDADFKREIEQTFDIPIGGKRKAAAAGIFDLLVAPELDRAKAKRAHAFPRQPRLCGEDGICLRHHAIFRQSAVSQG